VNASAQVAVSPGRVGATVAGSVATAVGVRAGLGPLASDRAGRMLRDAVASSGLPVSLGLEATDGSLRIMVTPGPELLAALQASFGSDQVAERDGAAEIVIERPDLRLAD
jgi:hypothetical protein